MPRPKRSKVAPSAPAQLPESLMRAIRADTLSEKEAVEKTIRRSSTRQASKVVAQDFSMSGALGVRNNDSPAETIAVGANRNTRDGNTTASESEELEIVPSSMEPLKVQEVEASSTAVPSTVQRPIPQKTALLSGNWRAQATPRFDSSVLGNFKRRPRQPSILGIGRQDDSSTMSNLGGVDSDPFYSELEDFDRGIATPLAQSKIVSRKEIASATHKSDASTVPTSNTRKRRREPSQDPAEILIPRSPQLTSEEADRLFASSPAPNNEQPDETEPSLPRIVAPATSRSSETSPPEVWSDTMAPPQSSPSETPSEPKKLEASPKPKGRRRKPLASPASSKKSLPRTRAQSSRVLKPISTAQLQNMLPLRRDKSQKDDSINLADSDPNNEDESSFIPTKRTRALSKQPKTPIKSTSISKSNSKPTLHDKTNTKRTIPASAIRNTTTKPPSAIKSPKTSRTYTRSSRVASGQENPRDTFTLSTSTQESSEPEDQDISNTTLADLDPKSKSELNAIVKKFAEVDEWEMEFEEADESSGSGDVLLLGA